MTTCNHCIGTWDDGIGSNGLIHKSDWRKYVIDTSCRFKFCPKCGEEVGHLEEPSPIRRYRRKPRNETERMMQDTADMLAYDVLNRLARPSMSKLLTEPFPESMGATIETITVERSLNATTPKESDPQ